MHSIEQIKSILADTLCLGERAATLTANTRLFGNLSELDSMAIISVITAMEEHFGLVFDDEDINASVFETVGTLSALVDLKLAQ